MLQKWTHIARKWTVRLKEGFIIFFKHNYYKMVFIFHIFNLFSLFDVIHKIKKNTNTHYYKQTKMICYKQILI